MRDKKGQRIGETKIGYKNGTIRGNYREFLEIWKFKIMIHAKKQKSWKTKWKNCPEDRIRKQRDEQQEIKKNWKINLGCTVWKRSSKKGVREHDGKKIINKIIQGTFSRNQKYESKLKGLSRQQSERRKDPHQSRSLWIKTLKVSWVYWERLLTVPQCTSPFFLLVTGSHKF